MQAGEGCRQALVVAGEPAEVGCHAKACSTTQRRSRSTKPRLASESSITSSTMPCARAARPAFHPCSPGPRSRPRRCCLWRPARLAPGDPPWRGRRHWPVSRGAPEGGRACPRRHAPSSPCGAWRRHSLPVRRCPVCSAGCGRPEQRRSDWADVLAHGAAPRAGHAHGFEHAGRDPALRLIVHRMPEWKVARQQPPGRPSAHQPAQRVKDGPQVVPALRRVKRQQRQVRGHKGPLLFRAVGRIVIGAVRCRHPPDLGSNSVRNTLLCGFHPD